MTIAARTLLITSLIFGFTYPLIWDAGLSVAHETLWKGAGVAILALFAAYHARDKDGWLLVLVMTFGALGDMMLEHHVIGGALLFVVGHIFAITLYLRNRRTSLMHSQKLLALLIIPLSTIIAWLLPSDRAQAILVATYTLIVATMASTAWISRFPRYWTGFGAMLFLFSDLLIFARMGPLAGVSSAGLVIWISYYVGQVMICWGVVRTLKINSPPSEIGVL